MNFQTLKYSASFTAGALLFNEFDALLELLMDKNSTNRIAEEIKNNKYIQINSETGRRRMLQEIIKRYLSVPIELWLMYKQMPDNEKKLVLFYSCLKTYRLLFDFHFEVTLKRQSIAADYTDKYFYMMKLDEIGMNDPKVDTWTDKTKIKTITVYQRILREVGMLKDGKLIPLEASLDVWLYFAEEHENWFFDACLINANRKKEILKYC